jgi:hypothetical protein
MGVETALAIGIPLAISAIGTIIQSGNRSDITQAGQQKLQNMSEAANSYGAYRSDQADARMKAMDQQMGMFKGAGNILNAMYGGAGGGGASSGGYTPGGGGYTPPPVVNPGQPMPTIPGRPDFTPKNNDGSIKGTPSGAPDGGGPPIVVIGPGGIGYDGPAPGSSGTSLVGPMPGANPMVAGLAGPAPRPAAANPMIAGLIPGVRQSTR